MSSIIRRRRGLMGVSVMGGLPEIGLNTQSSDSSPLSVTALLIAPGARLRVALYRESGLVLRRSLVIASRITKGSSPPTRTTVGTAVAGRLRPDSGHRSAREMPAV